DVRARNGHREEPIRKRSAAFRSEHGQGDGRGVAQAQRARRTPGTTRRGSEAQPATDAGAALAARATAARGRGFAPAPCCPESAAAVAVEPAIRSAIAVWAAIRTRF